MNRDSEQLTPGLDLVLAQDQPLSPSQLKQTVMNWLGSECEMIEINGKKQIVFHSIKGDIVLLCKCTTYLGNPHPAFKKRIQIPKNWLTETQELLSMGYKVKFIGVYHYNGLVIFVDFNKDAYLKRLCHNSSAHVYINDLYQGQTNKVFSKTDQNGNKIATIGARYLKDYLNDAIDAHSANTLLNLFVEFNYGFSFGQWMTAIETIQEMHKKHWSQWKQTEWPAWFLEYRFSVFCQGESSRGLMEYTGLSHKGSEGFDFDLWFPRHEFYGDLKASNKSKSESPGNDKDTLLECINCYGKFWYIIYEHATIKDSAREYEATKFRNEYIHKHSPKDYKGPMSYHQRMKHSVMFTNMCILELNRINMHQVLVEFNQGRQPDGNARKPKFNIEKKEIDNFVVYRYAYKEAEK